MPFRQRRSRVGGFVKGAALLVLGALLTGAGLLLVELRWGYLTQLLVTPPTPVSAQLPRETAVARQAEAWGVVDCADRIQQLSEYLMRNTDNSWIAQRGEKDPNSEVFAATIVARERNTGVQGLSRLFAAPSGKGSCGAGYETTIYLAEPCPQARQSLFPSFSIQLRFGELAEAYTNPEQKGALFLMPAGAAGCVLMKTELLY